jgi:hypothetical protein
MRRRRLLSLVLVVAALVIGKLMVRIHNDRANRRFLLKDPSVLTALQSRFDGQLNARFGSVLKSNFDCRWEHKLAAVAERDS